jgi:hypothetical protein
MIAEYTQTPNEQSPTTKSFIIDGFPCKKNEVRQIKKVTRACKDVQNKKEIKYLMFLWPIHVPTHGQ